MDELAMVVLGVSVMLVRVGGLLLACGSGRARFAATAAWRSVLEGALVAVGAAIVAGVLDSAGWLGEVPGSAVLAAALMGAAVLSAAAGERTRTHWAVATALVYVLGVIPGVWLLNGWLLADFPLEDPAGVMAVGMTAGWVSLVAVVLAGPRTGRFHRDGSIAMIPPHQQPMVLTGLLVLVAGWAGGWSVLGGEEAVVGLEPWLLAPAAAVLTAAVYGRLRFGRVDVGLLVPAAVGGVLSGAMLLGPIGVWGGGLVSLGVGALAGWASAWVHLMLERHLRVDDVTGVIAGQLVGPSAGGLVAGLVAGGRVAAFTQLFAIAVYVALAVTLALVVLWGVRSLTTIRIDESAEYEGLDLAGLDLNAYPDFQQPMIRSSHLREV